MFRGFYPFAARAQRSLPPVAPFLPRPRAHRRARGASPASYPISPVPLSLIPAAVIRISLSFSNCSADLPHGGGMQRTTRALALIMTFCVALDPGTLSGQSTADQLQGLELAAAVNVHERDVSLQGDLFLADGSPTVRCLIVILNWGLGQQLYQNQELRRALDTLACGLLQLRIRNIRTTSERGPASGQVVRNAALGGADGLSILVRRLAQESERPELGDVPFLFWGHSAAGTFGITYAALHPQRTIAFVRYNSHLRRLPVAMDVLTEIPGLLFAGERDQVAGVDDTRSLWRRGRSTDAPWTFAVQPGGPHGSAEFMKTANALLIPWLRAIVQARLLPGSSGLRALSDTSGWLGNQETAEVAASRGFSESRAEASWLPDELSARGWQSVVRASR